MEIFLNKTGRVDANNVITKEELIDQGIAQPCPLTHIFLPRKQKNRLKKCAWRTRVDPFALG